MTTPTLRDYAVSHISLSGFNTDLKPRTVTLFNSVLNLSFVFVISGTEPTSVLPMNVIWLVMDKTSPWYQKFVVRQSKTAASGFRNTWKPATEVADLWVPQYYDAGDNAAYAASLADATSSVAGAARLTYPSATPLTPVFVAVGDPRLSDARDPLAHTHPEKPMVSVKTLTSEVNVSNVGQLTDSATLVADSATSATQRPLLRTEVL